MKVAMLYAILERVAVFSFKSTSKVALISPTKKSKFNVFMQSSKFFEKFPSSEEEQPSKANECVVQ